MSIESTFANANQPIMNADDEQFDDEIVNSVPLYDGELQENWRYTCAECFSASGLHPTYRQSLDAFIVHQVENHLTCEELELTARVMFAQHPPLRCGPMSASSRASSRQTTPRSSIMRQSSCDNSVNSRVFNNFNVHQPRAQAQARQAVPAQARQVVPAQVQTRAQAQQPQARQPQAHQPQAHQQGTQQSNATTNAMLLQMMNTLRAAGFAIPNATPSNNDTVDQLADQFDDQVIDFSI